MGGETKELLSWIYRVYIFKPGDDATLHWARMGYEFVS
jgi:hypothetical protein